MDGQGVSGEDIISPMQIAFGLRPAEYTLALAIRVRPHRIFRGHREHDAPCMAPLEKYRLAATYLLARQTPRQSGLLDTENHRFQRNVRFSTILRFYSLPPRSFRLEIFRMVQRTRGRISLDRVFADFQTSRKSFFVHIGVHERIRFVCASDVK